MPHDKDGVAIKAGDVVMMRFNVTSVSPTESGCNVSLVAADVEPDDYAPMVTCNAKLVTKINGDADAPF